MWEEYIITTVRVLINDLNEPYDFSDERIKQVALVAANYIQFDINLDTTYSIDLINKNITPDPVANKDEIFLALLGLKCACMFDQGTFRTKAALEGIQTVLGPASLSIGGNLGGWRDILDHGACGLYQNFTDYWDIKNATAFAAVLSPFVGNRFDPRYLLRGSSSRGGTGPSLGDSELYS